MEVTVGGTLCGSSFSVSMSVGVVSAGSSVAGASTTGAGVSVAVASTAGAGVSVTGTSTAGAGLSVLGASTAGAGVLSESMMTGGASLSWATKKGAFIPLKIKLSVSNVFLLSSNGISSGHDLLPRT